MTIEEATELRKLTAQLYWRVRVEFFRTYYLIYNHKPPRGVQLTEHIEWLLKTRNYEDAFDAFVQSRWEDSNLADDFVAEGSYGYRVLKLGGWNPTKRAEEPPLLEEGEP